MFRDICSQVEDVFLLCVAVSHSCATPMSAVYDLVLSPSEVNFYFKIQIIYCCGKSQLWIFVEFTCLHLCYSALPKYCSWFLLLFSFSY